MRGYKRWHSLSGHIGLPGNAGLDALIQATLSASRETTMEVRMKPIKRLLLVVSMLLSPLVDPISIQQLMADNTVTISWYQNTEGDLSGYRLYYGITPGQYDFMEEVERDTSVTVTDLARATYYFVVTAYDTAGNESDFSEEISWTPGKPLGTTDGGEGSRHLPRSCNLSQNFPNPFNPSTTIQYSISDERGIGKVPTSVRIYSLRGRAIKTLVDEERSPGEYLAYWNGENDSGEQVASGTYLYHLQAGSYSAVRKMVLGK